MPRAATNITSSERHSDRHRASPVYADGKIYLTARDGVVTVVKAGRKFEVLASNDLGEPAESISASPAISNGRIYLRTFDALYCHRSFIVDRSGSVEVGGTREHLSTARICRAGSSKGPRNSSMTGKKEPVWSVAGRQHCLRRPWLWLFAVRPDADRLQVLSRIQDGQRGQACNSGIGIRGVAFNGPKETRPSFAGYEIQLLDDSGDKPNDHSTGSLYRYVAATANSMKPAGEWNQFEVECTGPRIRVTINGTRVQDVDQSKIESNQGQAA